MSAASMAAAVAAASTWMDEDIASIFLSHLHIPASQLALLLKLRAEMCRFE